MLALRYAANAGASTAVRFAALTHDLGKALTPQEMLPSHRGHEEAGVAARRGSLRAAEGAQRFRELAVLTAAITHWCIARPSCGRTTLLTLLETADAFRRPERFAELLLACECDARGRTGLEDRPLSAGGYLLRARATPRRRSHSPRRSERACKGAAIGARIREKRLAAVSDGQEPLRHVSCSSGLAPRSADHVHDAAGNASASSTTPSTMRYQANSVKRCDLHVPQQPLDGDEGHHCRRRRSRWPARSSPRRRSLVARLEELVRASRQTWSECRRGRRTRSPRDARSGPPAWRRRWPRPSARCPGKRRRGSDTIPTQMATFQVTSSTCRPAGHAALDDAVSAFRPTSIATATGMTVSGSLNPSSRRHETAAPAVMSTATTELAQIVAVLGLTPARRAAPAAAPVDQHDGENGARLDGDVEQLGALAQPLLGDQQMPGAGDRQELGDAFDDAENDGVQSVGHDDLAAAEQASCSRVGRRRARRSDVRRRHSDARRSWWRESLQRLRPDSASAPSP